MLKANCPLSDIVSIPDMVSGLHHLEEGDQLVLLNAFVVMHKNLIILLTGHSPFLPLAHYTLEEGKGEDIYT